MWFLAGAALLLVAFFIFAVRSSRGPDFAFLNGAKLTDLRSASYRTTMSRRAGQVQWRTSQCFVVSKDRAEVEKELDAAGWTKLISRHGELIYEGPRGECVIAWGRDNVRNVIYSRDSTFTDFVGCCLWRIVN